MEIQWILISILYAAFGIHHVLCEGETVATLRTQSVTLMCPIDVSSCGELHSVKWFKGSDRIAVVSGDGSIENVMSDYTERMSVVHNPKGPSTKLNIKSVQVSDEAIYICETTFLEPLETCESSGSYSIELKVHVPPSLIQIVDESNSVIKNSTTLGPLREGHRFTSTCEVKGSRPIPLVRWYRAGKRLTDSIITDESNGLYSVKSTLSLVLSRQELGSFIECRVETPALNNIVSNQIYIDLQVRPTKVELSGLKHHAVQGTNLLLICQVSGARPAANLTWYNNSVPLVPDEETDKRSISTITEFQNDGTFETIGKMLFTASRFENGVQIHCKADNVVMRDNLENPLHDTLILEVLYPPVVTVSPANITVNESVNVLLRCEYEANPAGLKNVRWYKDEKYLDLSAGSERYEGGKPDQPPLSITNSSRQDIGSYTCELANEIGSTLSEDSINLDVYFVPIVELTMDPEGPIIENEESNVTLNCNVLQGNPSTLQKVRWFLDGQVLKELPECDSNGNLNDSSASTDDSLCDVNPNILLLENVGREFLGNYSCEGSNLAGWGERSEENDLVIYYEPGYATITHYPEVASKMKSVAFTCSVKDGGNPPATRYRWLRGGRPIMDVVTPIWTIDPIGLDSRTNISCYAYNGGGEGLAATVNLDVRAQPTFIKKLPPYTGALYTIPEFYLYCRVECAPACTITWFKDGIGIDDDDEDDRYYIKESYLPPNPSFGDFESIESYLYFNMSAWPEGKLNIYNDNSNYSCVSSANVDGPGVRSTTYFGVEYPPENTTVSNPIIDVVEGSKPQRVSCMAKAYPEAFYEWRRNDISIKNNSVLMLDKDMELSDAGDYHCIATNKHGSHVAIAKMNILYKPNCSITRMENNNEDTLVCRGFGNPSIIDFEWSLKNVNDTIDLAMVKNSKSGDVPASFLTLNKDFTVMRTYRCIANNSVGPGNFCEIDVAGHLYWWQRLDNMTAIILIAAIIAILLAVIIACICIICVCRRRRRRQNKLQDKSSAAGDPLTDPGEYENLPFHGMQSAPNKPLSPDDLADDLEYADVDFRSYGPINYKAASIYALVKKNRNGNLKEIGKQQ